MFLAKKRIAIARADGYKEGFAKARAAARATARANEQDELAVQMAKLAAAIEQLDREIQLLRAARYTTTPSP